jgi:peroxiredoxin Q/BCP
LVNRNSHGEVVSAANSWIGQPFPTFNMQSDDRQEWDNERLHGSWSVVFFYPKDRSPGCSVQAQTFAKEEQQFAAYGARLFGVSSDSIESHALFKCDVGGELVLLSDRKSQLREKLRLGRTLGIIPQRVTFVIDPQGTVKWVLNSQFGVKRHVYGSLKYLSTL